MKMAVYVVIAILVVWLSWVSYVLYKTRTHYLHLTRATRQEKLDQILDKILDDHKLLTGEIEAVKKATQQIATESGAHFRHIGLVRFDAFGKSHNDQSFVLALLSAEKNGIVITFIYTHDGVRIYAKEVKNGQGVSYKLSQEEQRAIAVGTKSN